MFADHLVVEGDLRPLIRRVLRLTAHFVRCACLSEQGGYSRIFCLGFKGIIVLLLFGLVFLQKVAL